MSARTDMDESMMRADLALRGWELIGGCWARAGMGGTLMFLAYNGVRVEVLQAALPDASDPHTVELLSHPRYPMDLDRLRTCHDVITKFERGLYEPATDGRSE